jgi:hypothetical protein
MIFQFSQFSAVQVTKSAHMGQRLGQESYCLFTFGASQIVFAAGQFVLHLSVADHQSGMVRDKQRAIFERSAIQHECFSCLSVARRKLIHDAASSPDEFIFGALA